MKQRFSFAVLGAVALAPALVVPAMPASASQGKTPVYTWVDKNGVRHYADHPGNPNAVPVSLQVLPARSTLRSKATRTGSSPHAPPGQQTVPPPVAKKESQARLAAECKTLKRQVNELVSARRIRVTRAGKVRYVSGENLVKFRQKLKRRMQQACSKSPPS